MHILVTGSSGTIGTRLCETLLKKGHTVTGIDRRPNMWNPDVQSITTTVDLLNENELAAYRSPLTADVVVHLAANARVYDLVRDPNRARENMVTTFNILEWARRNSIPRFLFASSREVYGNIPDSQLPFEGLPRHRLGIEMSPSGPNGEARSSKLAEGTARFENCESPYTASKLAGEALVHAYTRCYGIDHVILRFSNVYGMYDDSDRVIPLFLRRARRNEPLTIFGKEKCLDFTYIDDTVAGIVLACENFDRAKNETCNIAFGEGTTIVHLAERVKELTNSSSKITVAPSRTGEVIHYVADITKAKEVLGYSPQVPFEDGIKKTVEWYSNYPPPRGEG